MNRVASVIAALMIAGCSSHPSEITSLSESPVIEMSVSDTIGVEYGDDRFVFGDICDLATDAEGNLLVLDRVSCEVCRYNPEGEYLGMFAGAGSGPGELMDPTSMTVLSGGGVAVADWDAWGIVFYDSCFVYRTFLGPMPGGAPLAITAGADGSVTGLGVQFWSGSEQPEGEYFLAAWSDSTSEKFRFMSGPAGIETFEGGEVSISLPDVYFDSSPDHKLYSALSTDSTFVVRCFSPSGEELAGIQENWEKIQLNSVSREERDTEALINGEEVSSEVLYASAIAGVYCDDTGNVWVRLGTTPYPVFSVYSSEGLFLNTVQASCLADPLFELDFHFNGDKVFAWNTDPVDYPRVFILNNPLFLQ